MSNYQELINLILRPYESKEHDFKGPMAWNGNAKKACCEIVKDILAIANTKGGFIVIGVEDTKICKTDYPRVLTKPTLYVRTDNNESAPISTTSDFHALIESAISKREQSLLTAIRSIIKGHELDKDLSQTINEQYTDQISHAIKSFEDKNILKEKNYIGYREVTFYPMSLFDDKRFEISKLKDALKQASVNFRGWPFVFVSGDPKELYVIQDGIESLIAFPDFNGNDRIDFWRLYTSGLFYHRSLMWEESDDRKRRPKMIDLNYVHSKKHKGSTMDFIALTFYVAEAVNSLVLLYTALGMDEGLITARFRVTGTDNRLLVSYDTSRELSMAYIAMIPEIVEERTYSLNEWKAGIVDLSVDVIKSILS